MQALESDQISHATGKRPDPSTDYMELVSDQSLPGEKVDRDERHDETESEQHDNPRPYHHNIPPPAQQRIADCQKL